MDIIAQHTIQQRNQQVKPTNQQTTPNGSPAREGYKALFELDITPKEEEQQERELTAAEKASIPTSDSKFPTIEFLRITKQIHSVSNMISRDRKAGATEQRLAQLSKERDDLKRQKIAAEKALYAAGINPKDVKEVKA